MDQKMLESVTAVSTTDDTTKIMYWRRMYDARTSLFDSPSSGAKICESESIQSIQSPFFTVYASSDDTHLRECDLCRSSRHAAEIDEH